MEDAVMKSGFARVALVCALCLALAPLFAQQAKTEMPTRGGQAVLIRSVDFGGMDPLTADYFPATVYNRLLAYRGDDSGKFQLYPELAESWRYSDDGLKITFNLRKGVKFHDGSAFNAEVAAWNIRRYAQDPKSVVRTRYMTFVDEKDPVVVIDPNTIQVKLKTPAASALLSLSENQMVMVSKKAVDDNGPDYLATHPVGTGPFVFGKWVPGSSLEVTKNPNYWDIGADGKPLPYLDKLVYRYIRDYSTALSEMLAGSADFSEYSIDEPDLDRVRQTSGLVAQQTQVGINDLGMQLFFNASKAPFKDNLNLRQAFQYAIDREAGAKVMFGSQGMAYPWFFVPGVPGYSTSVPAYSYNLAKAKEYLAKAGVPIPFETTLTIINRDQDIKAAQIVQSMLDKADIHLKVEVLERAAWQEKVRTPTAQFEIAMRFSGVNLDSASLLSLIWAESGQTAYMRAHVDGLMETIALAAKAPTQEAAALQLQKAQALMHDSAWMVYLWKRSGFVAINARLQGVPKYLWNLEEMSIGPKLWMRPKK
jgi:ABC-type transport system substrate-binding protein